MPLKTINKHWHGWGHLRTKGSCGKCMTSFQRGEGHHRMLWRPPVSHLVSLLKSTWSLFDDNLIPAHQLHSCAPSHGRESKVILFFRSQLTVSTQQEAMWLTAIALGALIRDGPPISFTFLAYQFMSPLISACQMLILPKLSLNLSWPHG